MYAYEELLEEHNLTMAELPEDAKNGIKQIKDVERALSVAEKVAAKKDKTFVPSEATKTKIKLLDKWITREIWDFVEDKDTNTDAPSDTAADIIEDVKDEVNVIVDTPPVVAPTIEIKPDVDTSKGDAIHFELKNLYETNKRLININDLRDAAPNTHSFILSTYEKDKENGINVGEFSILQTENLNEFKINQKQ